MGIDKPTFIQHVREALDHFYEPAYLCTSPLAECLLSDSSMDMASDLRELLRAGIEKLRPPQSVPFGSPEWYGYRILWAHCIQRRSWFQIGDELALGKSSVYKYRQQAVNALGASLWRQYQGMLAAQQIEQDKTTTDQNNDSPQNRVADEALRLAQNWPRVPIRTRDIIEDVNALTSPLAAMHNIVIEWHVADDISSIYANKVLLHQIMANIMIAAIEHSPPGTLSLDVSSTAANAVTQIHYLPHDTDQRALLHQMSIAQQLVSFYGGHVRLDRSDPGLTIRLSLPSGDGPLILAVDDDDDILALYRRLLSGSGYSLRVARDTSEMFAQMGQARPDLIVLDVLMPHEDGWMTLQKLKTLPETASIPVLVCSVLGQPSMALALGAAAVLRKPLKEKELLCSVQEAIASRGSP